jgi:predicted nucleotidyltransferase component of viral defense system
LSDRPTLQELLEVQQKLGLPSPALVEKDWHVVKALAAVALVDANPFRLVFGGGTALGRAYGLLKRMSEDIDLRIVADQTPTRAQLRALRHKITDALLNAEFQFNPDDPAHRQSMYEGRYTIYRLPYAPTSEGKGALRPEIRIETAVFPLRHDAVERPVTSFINEGYSRAPEIAAIPCASIPETAAEKLVALTRRAGAEIAGLRETKDHTLVRHIHDLHAIRGQYDIAAVASLAHEIMMVDAATRAKDFPAYETDPLAETLKAIDGICASADMAAAYETFTRDMVYGERSDFKTAVETLQHLGQQLRKQKRPI